jgi:glutamyl-tRNA(Gln) amidotransferase subunit E
MPLIEVVTEPEMYTPQEVPRSARSSARLLPQHQKVRRGYGATRQDVNVSVTGGTRIEIKGVPQIWRIPRLVYNEASRQWALLKIRDTLHDRGVKPDTSNGPRRT